MIIGLGIDSIEIERFTHWHNRSIKILLKILSPYEINYCLSNNQKSAERFAARFAAKEAFFKASYILHENKISFLTICKHVEVEKTLTGIPFLSVNWKLLTKKEHNIFKTHLSITHTKTIATAIIFIES